MTPTAFTTTLVDAYQLARRPLHQNDKLHRGESRSVASEIEDLLAFYLVDNLPLIDDIRINQPMSIIVKKRRKTIKPDLVVIRDGAIRVLVDVKMDLGYKRDGIASTFSKASGHIKAMRGQTAKYWDSKRSAGGVQRPVMVCPDAAYIFVVVSYQNISKIAYSKVEAAAHRVHNISLHTLVRGVHPNDYALSAADILSKCLPQVATTLPAFEAAIANAVA